MLAGRGAAKVMRGGATITVAARLGVPAGYSGVSDEVKARSSRLRLV